ncbi:MAG: DUF1615 family protein [Nitrososphaerales archaeon]
MSFAVCVALLWLAACGKKETPPIPLSVQDISALIKLSTKNGSESDLWARDIHSSIEQLKLDVSKSNVCAVISIIEQESSFNPDPVVSGIASILKKRLDKATRKLVLGQLVKIRLGMRASNNQTFRRNINSIRTERDLERWFQEFILEEWGGDSVLQIFGQDIDYLISTLGSMQVSIFYAREYAKKKDIEKEDLREYLYSREGGVFFGTAHLLDYKAEYPDLIYRFADYNAGQYASRNAGFQEMLARLSGRRLSLDGDLLTYRGGSISPSKSYEAACAALAKHLDKDQILDDFKQGKEESFIETSTYKTICQLYSSKYNDVAKARIPDIQLQSDKLSKKRTTEWYANTVTTRFKQCMTR